MQRLIPVLRADSWVSPYPVACGRWAVCSVLGSLPFQPGFSYQGNLLWACCLETRRQTRSGVVFELEEGRLMGPPEILHDFYFRFALWPRDTSFGIVFGKFKFEVKRE